MPLDPGLGGVLAYMASLNLPPMSTATPEQARRAFRRATYDHRPASLVLSVGSVTEGTLDGPDGPLPVRTYQPEGLAGPVPSVLFLHGGGWVLGDPNTC